ncbi:MAG: GTPase, partial [Thermoanaerobaculia bacterium]|nr:GTPase [Thermoanaerobaculia bacterium]
MLSAGIVGLPNVGKSTLFNALTRAEAEVASYPFTTIDPNVGVVPVPDPRLAALEEALDPDEAIPSSVRFLDIAGLVEGASRGEGLGNRFLGEIRAVDAMVHVLRCFTDENVAHPLGQADPEQDAEVIETELLLADLEVLDRAIEKRKKGWQTAPREHGKERDRLARYRETLEEGRPLRELDLDDEDRRELTDLGLITGKRLLYVANCDEDEVGGDLAPRLEEAL